MKSKQPEALAAAPLGLPESTGEVVTRLLELARIVYNAADDWGESHADGTSTVIFQKSEADALDAILDYFDSLPENPDPLILDSGPLKAARILLASGGPGPEYTPNALQGDLERTKADLAAMTEGYDAARLEIASLQAEVAKYREPLNPSTYAGCAMWAGDYRVMRLLSKTEVCEWRSPVIALQVLTDVCASELARFLAKQPGETP